MDLPNLSMINRALNNPELRDRMRSQGRYGLDVLERAAGEADLRVTERLLVDAWRGPLNETTIRAALAELDGPSIYTQLCNERDGL